MADYSRRRISRMLHDVDVALTADARGAALEELAQYLLSKIRGVSFLKRNVLDAPRAHELDLAFWNDQSTSRLSFLDALLIVECKATATPVSSEAVGWFVRKLQDRTAHHGILVALPGITGSGESAARNEIVTALIRDKIKILVLTREEIARLRSTDQLVEILREKYLELALERTVNAPRPKRRERTKKASRKRTRRKQTRRTQTPRKQVRRKQPGRGRARRN